MPENLHISSTATSPFLVITPEGYTKHYYAGTERIAAQVGKGNFANVNSSVCDPRDTQDKLTEVNGIATYLVSYASPKFTYLNTLPILSTTQKEIYYYHTDHLGSSAWITDSLGVAVQHLAYLPWGEPYVTQKTGNFNPTYTFSGKERDEETGYSYFGQRFYDSQLSIWLSVDPMRGKYPSLSPFVYCANNPVRLVDPNGMEINIIEDIVIHGTNKSSITIKTNLIDCEYSADVDFKGNHTINPEYMAIGYERGLTATGTAGVGTSYNGTIQSVMFMGGDYSGYWYDYAVGEVQLQGTSWVDASIGVQANLLFGFYAGEKNDKSIPTTFEGTYFGTQLSTGLKAAAGLNCNVSFSWSKESDTRWFVLTIGASLSIGVQIGGGIGLSGVAGHSKLLNDTIKTNERSFSDRLINMTTHIIP